MNSLKKINLGFFKRNYFSINKNKYWGVSTIIDCKECNYNIKNKEAIEMYIKELSILINMKKQHENCNFIYSEQYKKISVFSMANCVETSSIGGHFVYDTMSAYIDIFSSEPYDTIKVLRFTEKFFGSTKTYLDVSYRY